MVAVDAGRPQRLGPLGSSGSRRRRHAPFVGLQRRPQSRQRYVAHTGADRSRRAGTRDRPGVPDARLVGIGCTALVLLLLVAALARDAGSAGAGAGGGAPTVELLPLLSSISLVAMGALLVAMLVTGLRRPGRLLLAVLLALLVGAAALWAISTLSAGGGDRRREPVDEPAASRDGRPTADDWSPTGPGLLVLVAGLAAGSLLVARLRPSRAEDDEAGAEEGPDEGEAGQALAWRLGEVIDELRDDPDPRRAVIRAWARLEALLAVHGSPRRASELTSAYVERALVRLATSRPAVRALTVTFERAMYAHHPIGRDEQLAAVDVLVAVRDDLGVRV